MMYLGFSDLNSSSDAENACMSLESTLVRVPRDSFRQDATLATMRAFASKKYVPSIVGALRRRIGQGSAVPSVVSVGPHWPALALVPALACLLQLASKH